MKHLGGKQTKKREIFKACILLGIVILGSSSKNTVSAKERVPYSGNLEIVRYERLAEQYLSEELSAEELEQKYEGKVEIEIVPITKDKLDELVTPLIDGKKSKEVDCSVELERIQFADAESCMYVLSAEAKKSSETKKKDGATLSGTINWIDKTGLNNVLTSVSATRLGSFAGTGTYSYGGKFQILKSGTFSGNGFNDQENWGAVSSSFHLNVSTPTASGNTLSIKVNTSVLD